MPMLTALKAKELWQMSEEEFYKSYDQISGGKAPGVSQREYDKLRDNWRKTYIERAIRDGKPVSAEVLKDYPELQSPQTFSHEDTAELIAGLDLRRDELDGRIDRGKATLESMKEALDPRIAKLTELIPTTKEGRSEITHITKGKYQKIWGKTPPASIVSQGKVRWEYALDTIAQELHLEGKAQTEGKAPDEYLKGLIEQAKEDKELIGATASEVKFDEATLAALEKLKASIKAKSGKTTTESLLQTLAKPKLRGKPKYERKAEKMLASVARELIRKTQAARTPQAIAMDNALLAKRIVTPSQAPIWARNPNRYDIKNVDTPRRGRQRRKQSRRTPSRTVVA